MTKQEALTAAKRATKETGREHIVRMDFGPEYHVCPRYEVGRERSKADAGYEVYGVIVAESLGGT